LYESSTSPKRLRANPIQLMNYCLLGNF
jgi:hypothetical protein